MNFRRTLVSFSKTFPWISIKSHSSFFTLRKLLTLRVKVCQFRECASWLRSFQARSVKPPNLEFKSFHGNSSYRTRDKTKMETARSAGKRERERGTEQWEGGFVDWPSFAFTSLSLSFPAPFFYFHDRPDTSELTRGFSFKWSVDPSDYTNLFEYTNRRNKVARVKTTWITFLKGQSWVISIATREINWNVFQVVVS